jgi:hypothetical protein
MVQIFDTQMLCICICVCRRKYITMIVTLMETRDDDNVHCMYQSLVMYCYDIMVYNNNVIIYINKITI